MSVIGLFYAKDREVMFGQNWLARFDGNVRPKAWIALDHAVNLRDVARTISDWRKIALSLTLWP